MLLVSAVQWDGSAICAHTSPASFLLPPPAPALWVNPEHGAELPEPHSSFCSLSVLYMGVCICSFVLQSLSHLQLFATPWTAAHRARLSFTISQSLHKFMSTKSVMLSNHLILCHPLLLLPSIFPSIRVFSSESTLRIRWPKYWSFSFSISPCNEYSGFISFRMDWFNLLAVRGTLKSLP